MALYRHFVVPRLIRISVGDIRRDRRDQCWCGATLLPFKWHPEYGKCAECGCYVSRFPPQPQELSKIYAFEDYWHTRQKLRRYPTIDQRPDHDRKDGRLDRWLDVIERYCPSHGLVIEVGCAHAVLSAELKKRGYECVCVEIDEKTAQLARENSRVDVRTGVFPGVDLPTCDIFLAFDVLEHSLDPLAFMREAARLLKPAGVAVIQTPIDRHAFEPPFPELEVFDPLEHTFIFSIESFRHLAQTSGFETVAEATGTLPLDIVVLRKRD